MGVGIIFVIAIIAGMFFAWWSRNNSRSRYDKSKALLKDATIRDIKHEALGDHTTSASIRTTVLFSDGFIYTTHLYSTESNHSGGKTLRVTEHNREVIIKDAIEAHDAAYKKQQKNMIYYDFS